MTNIICKCLECHYRMAPEVLKKKYTDSDMLHKMIVLQISSMTLDLNEERTSFGKKQH